MRKSHKCNASNKSSTLLSVFAVTTNVDNYMAH